MWMSLKDKGVRKLLEGMEFGIVEIVFQNTTCVEFCSP